MTAKSSNVFVIFVRVACIGQWRVSYVITIYAFINTWENIYLCVYEKKKKKEKLVLASAVNNTRLRRGLFMLAILWRYLFCFILFFLFSPRQPPNVCERWTRRWGGAAGRRNFRTHPTFPSAVAALPSRTPRAQLTRVREPSIQYSSNVKFGTRRILFGPSLTRPNPREKKKKKNYVQPVRLAE